jgi:DNA repair exonuclease SbcCD ATPase subunit
MVRNLFILLLAFSFFTSCVSSKKYKQLDALKNDMKLENQALLQKLDEQVQANAGLESTNKSLRDEIYALKQDTTDCHNDVRTLTEKYNDLNKMYSDLGSQSKKELTALIQENQNLLKQLDEKQRQLTDKENALKLREERLKELEGLLAAKDAAINNLKKSIENALLNFNKDELTVELRDGKIYDYHPEYFRLKPTEKRLYEIAHCHCDGEAIEMTIEELYAKVGTTGPINEFKRQMKTIDKENRIPDYRIELIDVIPDILRLDARGRRIGKPCTLVVLTPRKPKRRPVELALMASRTQNVARIGTVSQ